MEKSEFVRLHVIIEGYVQGVGFRAFVIRRAAELGVTGWVRNRWDDTVEVVAEGDKTILEQLLAALRRGPSTARVTRTNPEWLPASGEFKSFVVKSTF